MKGSRQATKSAGRKRKTRIRQCQVWRACPAFLACKWMSPRPISNLGSCWSSASRRGCRRRQSFWRTWIPSLHLAHISAAHTKLQHHHGWRQCCGPCKRTKSSELVRERKPSHVDLVGMPHEPHENEEKSPTNREMVVVAEKLILNLQALEANLRQSMSGQGRHRRAPKLVFLPARVLSVCPTAKVPFHHPLHQSM